MKLFASALAITAVVAQEADERGFDYGGFDTYDLSAFDDSYGFGGENYYGFDENAYSDNYGVDDAAAVGAGRESEVAADAGDEDDERKGERYFFTPSATTTTTTTTTTTITPGIKCWKCDAMSYATCASAGSWQTCPLGDKDCCFVEIREQEQKLQQLCTGCKDKTACEDNRAENFLSTTATNNEIDQCIPDYREQKIGRRSPQQSVCRQCFQTCDPTGSGNGFGTDYCFGGIASTSSTPNVAFNLNTHQTKFAWNGHLSTADFTGFGIPTGAMMDATLDAIIAGKVAAATTAQDPQLLNVFFQSSTNGKSITGVGTDNGARETGEMTFWGLHGADRAWWTDDLKAIQSHLRARTISATIFATTDFQ